LAVPVGGLPVAAEDPHRTVPDPLERGPGVTVGEVPLGGGRGLRALSGIGGHAPHL
jgi:hypothetical protein